MYQERRYANKELQYSVESSRPQVQIRIKGRTKEDNVQLSRVGLGARVDHGGLHRGGDT